MRKTTLFLRLNHCFKERIRPKRNYAPEYTNSVHT